MKDWIGNKKSIYVQLGASNHTMEEREENDFYATDPIAIDKLFDREEFDENIWECACGMGHLSERIKKYNKYVWATDLIKRNDCVDDTVDFLKYNKTYYGDIITNPPYKFVSQFIIKALELIQPHHKVAMFLKLTTLEGQARYKKVFCKIHQRQFMYLPNEFNVRRMVNLLDNLPFAMRGLFGKKVLKESHK